MNHNRQDGGSILRTARRTLIAAAAAAVVLGFAAQSASAVAYSGHRVVHTTARVATVTTGTPAPGSLHVYQSPQRPVTTPLPDGPPRSQAGALEYAATGAQIAATWTVNPAADNHCTDPGITVTGTGVTLSTTGAAGDCSELADETASYTSGIFQVTVDLPGTATVADWPAFWMTSGEANTTSTWPQDGEQDFMESLLQNGAKCPDAHTNYGTSPATAVSELVGTECGVTPGWHTLTGVWTAGYLAVYCDGHQQFAKSDPSIVGGGTHAEDLMLTMDSAQPAAPASMTVASVDIWGYR